MAQRKHPPSLPVDQHARAARKEGPSPGANLMLVRRTNRRAFIAGLGHDGPLGKREEQLKNGQETNARCEAKES
jgi:hypothetical protein